jgi:glycosyltransferase involved in cell wall biosynthesis
MKRSSADIYFQRTSDAITGIVAAFCRKHNRKFIYSAASNADCQTHLPHCPLHERALYRYGIRRADAVIAQTFVQQRLLCENLRIRSTVIRNLGPDNNHSPIGPLHRNAPASKRVLWIGHILPDKRFELLLEIANHCPDVEFDVVGDAPGDSRYAHRLLARARLALNVHFCGCVPHREIGKFYDRAAVLLCTSRIEGFPNTFIEAFACGLPVISTFDPDGVIASQRLGIVREDAPGLLAAIRQLLEDPEEYRLISARTRKYYLENHTVEAVMPQLEALLNDLTEDADHCGKTEVRA